MPSTDIITIFLKENIAINIQSYRIESPYMKYHKNHIVLYVLIWMCIVQARGNQSVETGHMYFIKSISRHFLNFVNQIVSKPWKSQTWAASSGSTAFIWTETMHCYNFWFVHYYMNTKTLLWTRWAWCAGYSCQVNMQMRDNSLLCYGLSLNFQSYCSFAAGVFA